LTEEEKKHELSKYRIKQAEESLEEARFLLSGNKSPRSIINRAYYAMFYAVFELRQRGDYREYTNLSYEQVEPFIGEAEVFIKAIKNCLKIT
jgi:uncharacterized protein